MKRLEQLCHQYTNLSESDIKELQRTARYLSSTTLYQSADVFIDVYKEMSQQALVVYHKPPAKTTSLYSGTKTLYDGTRTLSSDSGKSFD